MQKYIAIYRRENDKDSYWCQAFVKKKDMALEVCREKAGNSRVTNVFVCEWRKPYAEPECILGDKGFGSAVAQSIIESLRKDNSISATKPAEKQDKSKPHVKAKALVAKTETPKYEPPYVVKYADIVNDEEPV